MAEKICRIRIAGGGTGGHLFPGLAVADELKRRHPEAELGFIGAERGIERRLVPEAGYPLQLLRLAGIQGGSPWHKATAALAAGIATTRCLSWMTAKRPDLVIGVGGYASGPAMLAARLLRVKTMVMEQNHYPGATNRWLAPRVDAVCVPSDAAARRLRGRLVVTGNPVRREFLSVAEAKVETPLRLLVFGGSRGASSINRAVAAAATGLAAMHPAPGLVVQTGENDEAKVADAFAGYPGGRAEVHAFLDDMPLRLEQANLAVCRAGATTLAELAAAGRPAVLVPYPHAADDHQRHNAEAVAEAGAAIVIRDDELDGERLTNVVADLIAEPRRLLEMGRAARTLARPDATARIADVADRLLAGDEIPEVTGVS